MGWEHRDQITVQGRRETNQQIIQMALILRRVRFRHISRNAEHRLLATIHSRAECLRSCRQGKGADGISEIPCDRQRRRRQDQPMVGRAECFQRLPDLNWRAVQRGGFIWRGERALGFGCSLCLQGWLRRGRLGGRLCLRMVGSVTPSPMHTALTGAVAWIR